MDPLVRCPTSAVPSGSTVIPMGADNPVATTDGSGPADGLEEEGPPLVPDFVGADGLVEAVGPDPGVTGLGSSV
jgi:hypothetical protein